MLQIPAGEGLGAAAAAPGTLRVCASIPSAVMRLNSVRHVHRTCKPSAANSRRGIDARRAQAAGSQAAACGRASGSRLTGRSQARLVAGIGARPARSSYDAAWAEATIARNSSSETGAPLRRADSAGNALGGDSQAMQNESGSPAPTVTGIPSTSKNSALGENLAGSTTDSVIDSTSQAIVRACRKACRTRMPNPAAAIGH